MYNYKIPWSGAPELAESNRKLLSQNMLELKMIARSANFFSTPFVKELAC